MRLSCDVPDLRPPSHSQPLTGALIHSSYETPWPWYLTTRGSAS